MTGEAMIARASSSSGSVATPTVATSGVATPGVSAPGAATPGVFEIPATAVFHKGENSAVWTIRPSDSTLELRPVNVRRYGERTAYVDRGLRDGDSIVAAGVHTVYAGEHVTPVKPLFASDDPHGESRGTAQIPRAASIAP
jgi:multidrug efflux pump subunit AcrA (membrane-fusion protein)